MSNVISELRQVAWVGGAFDHSTKLLKNHVPPGQHYFQWHERRAICEWLQKTDGKPTLLIAHSYGASTAAHIVASGYRVSELVTIDPVSWRRPNLQQLRKFVGHWRNYQAVDTSWNFANTVARCGGWWQQWPADYAHQHLQIEADHALIVGHVLASWRRAKDRVA